ncbi:MAG: phytanoyl-CoA dioxygenase family protein [Armatimonas sp.]
MNIPDPLTSSKATLDASPECLGELRDSGALASNGAALRERMAEDGYLYLRGALNRDLVAQVRHACLSKLSDAEWLEPGTNPADSIARKDGQGRYFNPALAENNPLLMELLYTGSMIDLYREFLDFDVAHFDYTWMRAVGPGGATQPHCDIVYMGRGTHQLYTSWTPLGDVNLTLGGLMVLENSHKRADITGEYLKHDVDTYCIGGPGEKPVTEGKIHWEHWRKPGEPWSGAFSDNPAELREQFGSRWLTAEFSMGDVLIFSMSTIHASIDNRTDHIRLSSDSRYQRADQPRDERWILGPNGEAPMNHTLAAKRGRVC